MSQPQQSSANRPQRDPPPTLFLHPSPAASNVSLPSAVAGPGPVNTSVPSAQAIATQQFQPRSSHDPLAAALSTLSRPGMERGGAATPAAGPRRGTLPPLQTASYTRRESTRATDRTDALWAEMQATLEEVELSASGGTRVFGPDHDRKLAELRAAQIALAQAWARSEADGAIEPAEATGAGGAASVSTERGGAELKTDGTEGAKSVGTGGASTRPGSSGVGADRLGQRLEEETETDIQFARKRREANDRYFQRVNQGVLDVVAKLDDVATAMRAVEQESKDVWGDESVPSSARP
ncbi:hypothetical protein N0V82_006620 [Gnomoniopsis sp. IMI 355080]|nr:hypothetical protein N0V82_006620 [Gnomoniopsis sp. IMI 355080]